MTGGHASARIRACLPRNEASSSGSPAPPRALPLLRPGLGPLMSTPLTGSLMILRTRGRKTGLLRETPLGYAILDGSVWCCAGFGARTHWYRNILADAGVEVVLANGSAFAGPAEVVTEPAAVARGFRPP